MKLSIVVPLFNEYESLPPLISGIDAVMKQHAYTYEVILVDDGSTDGSLDVCKKLYDQYKGIVKVYSFSRNYGKSPALSVGIDRTQGDIIVTMDADLQDDPIAIPDMIAQINKGWDVVSGWKKKRYDPITKTLPSKLWNFMTSTMSGITLHDFNCGFKAYTSAAAKSLEIYGTRHRYLPAMAHWDGFKVTEVVVPHHARKFGKSKFGMDRWNGLFDMLTLLFLRKYMKNPLHLFGLIGVLFGFAGAAVLAYFGVEWILTGVMKLRPLVLLAVGSIIMGIQFVGFGLIAELIVSSTARHTYTIKEACE